MRRWWGLVIIKKKGEEKKEKKGEGKRGENKYIELWKIWSTNKDRGGKK